MKINALSFITFILFNLFSLSAIAGAEEQLIRQTLNNYIEGTSYNKPKQIEKAFYKEANLLL